MYNKNEKNYLSNGDLLDEKESIDEFEEVHQSKKSKFFEKIKYILKICSNSNAIMLIAIIELAFQGTCRMIWFIIILSARIYFNGNLRVKKNI
jgi:hypothetical protein